MPVRNPTPERKEVEAGQMRPVVLVGSSSYSRGDFYKLWQELTALERSAFKKRMATALIEWPARVRNAGEERGCVAGLVRLPAAVLMGSSSYSRGDFHKL
jgi:hypothetical protein